jgi:hypothetical protein
LSTIITSDASSNQTNYRYLEVFIFLAQHLKVISPCINILTILAEMVLKVAKSGVGFFNIIPPSTCSWFGWNLHFLVDIFICLILVFYSLNNFSFNSRDFPLVDSGNIMKLLRKVNFSYETLWVSLI